MIGPRSRKDFTGSPDGNGNRGVIWHLQIDQLPPPHFTSHSLGNAAVAILTEQFEFRDRCAHQVAREPSARPPLHRLLCSVDRRALRTGNKGSGYAKKG
jgi:hypothetical protein